MGWVLFWTPRAGGLYHEVTFLRLQSVMMLCDITARTGLPASGGSAASLVTLLHAFWPSDSRSAPPHPIHRQFHEDWFTLHAPVSVLQLSSPRSPAIESECGALRAMCMRWRSLGCTTQPVFFVLNDYRLPSICTVAAPCVLQLGWSQWPLEFGHRLSPCVIIWRENERSNTFYVFRWQDVPVMYSLFTPCRGHHSHWQSQQRWAVVLN